MNSGGPITPDSVQTGTDSPMSSSDAEPRQWTQSNLPRQSSTPPLFGRRIGDHIGRHTRHRIRHCVSRLPNNRPFRDAGLKRRIARKNRESSLRGGHNHTHSHSRRRRVFRVSCATASRIPTKQAVEAGEDRKRKGPQSPTNRESSKLPGRNGKALVSAHPHGRASQHSSLRYS